MRQSSVPQKIYFTRGTRLECEVLSRGDNCLGSANCLAGTRFFWNAVRTEVSPYRCEQTNVSSPVCYYPWSREEEQLLYLSGYCEVEGRGIEDALSSCTALSTLFGQ